MSDDSDLEGDLADPYGPYSLFAKYLKPERKSREKFSKHEFSLRTPPKRVPYQKNGDWQNRLRFSDSAETESRFQSKFDLNKALFRKENLSERDDFRTYHKGSDRKKSCQDPGAFRCTRPLSERYDVCTYEKDKKIDPKKDRVDRDTCDLSSSLLKRYDFRTYEREEHLDFKKGLKDVDTYEITSPSSEKYDVRIQEKGENIDTRKGRKYRGTCELSRPAWDGNDIRDYEQQKTGVKRDRLDRGIYEPKIPFSEKYDFRAYEKEENVDLKKGRGGRETYGRTILPERYDVRNYDNEKKEDTKKGIKDREPSYDREEQVSLIKNRRDRETSQIDKHSDEVLKKKQSPESIREFDSLLDLYSEADFKRAKPFYRNETGSFENLSDGETSFTDLLNKFHIGPYLQKAISLTKKSVSSKTSADLPSGLNGRFEYSPSKLCEEYTENKSPEKRSSRCLPPDDFEEEYNKENIWKNVPGATVFSPDKTVSSDSILLRGDARTKWTSSPDVGETSSKSSPRAVETRKNSKVRSFSCVGRDLNDCAFDRAKRVTEIEKGDSAFSIDNLGLDLEKKRVGNERWTAKAFSKSGRYDSSEEYIDLDKMTQTTDSEQKAPPAHYHLPYVAVKRLTLPQAAPPRSKVRNSVLMAEIDRINHRVRPALGFSAVEHYLNSRLALSRKYGKRQTHISLRSDVDEENFDSCRKAILAMREKVDKKEIPTSAMANFDDETRMIRAQTAALLKSVHTPLPRSRPLILPTPSALMETPIPNRITSDAYIHGLLMPLSKVHTDVASRSFYVENPKPYIGKGHLACVSFAGGRAYAKRRSHLDEEPIHPRNVKNDIETLSFYSRARAVAKGEEPGPEPKAIPRKTRVYRPNTEAAREPAPRPRPVPASAPAPARQESVKETAPPPAKAPEPAPEPVAAPVTNGINGVEEDPELARLAEEEAELARMEAELAAQQTKKKKPKKQASEDADKAAEEAAKKSADDAAKKAAEEAAKKAADEAEAARKAEEEEAAKKEAELEAEIEKQVAAELEAEEARKKEAELEAELERQVAAELAAEEAKKKEAELEAELERQVAAELAAEEAKKKEAELEAEIERQVAAELAAEKEKKQEEAEQEVSNQEETDEPEPEPEAEPEPEVEPEVEPEPVVEPEPEVELAEVKRESENGEDEPLSEGGDDEPVIDEPLSQAEQDKSVNFWDDDAKVDEVDPLPED